MGGLVADHSDHEVAQDQLASSLNREPRKQLIPRRGGEHAVVAVACRVSWGSSLRPIRSKKTTTTILTYLIDPEVERCSRRLTSAPGPGCASTPITATLIATGRAHLTTHQDLKLIRPSHRCSRQGPQGPDHAGRNLAVDATLS